MPVPQRDFELTRKRLTEWFAGVLPDAEEISLSELSGPGATGFSSDTLMFDLTYKEGGEEHRKELVARLEPSGLRVFPEYDLGQQFRVMRALADTKIPVPRVLWREESDDVLDKNFFIMERIEGRVPPDSPPYHAEGWVTEIRPEERAAFWWDGLEVLAEIHRLDWRALGLGFLDQPERGATPLEQQLDFYEYYLGWVAEGRDLPISSAGLEWLKKNRPAERQPVAFCWGDSRIGNMLFHENRCVGVLDWEMMTLGNPEQDIAWWLFFDRHHSEGFAVPRLPGFPSREETIARYEELIGRELKHLEYYETFAAFRFSIIMVRVAQLLISFGLLPEDSDFVVNNPCTGILAKMLDIAPPGA
jgi:aminoglycoside phosphotransferase (APT) family kinase protein